MKPVVVRQMTKIARNERMSRVRGKKASSRADLGYYIPTLFRIIHI